MIPELLKETEDKMKKAVEAARHEFTLIRTGRAHPGILEHVRIEMYGQQMPLNQIAAVTVPEPRQLLITPFDKTALGAIEKGIMKSDVNITPNNDGTNVRLNIPPLTEDRRKDLIKQVQGKRSMGAYRCEPCGRTPSKNSRRSAKTRRIQSRRTTKSAARSRCRN